MKTILWDCWCEISEFHYSILTAPELSSGSHYSILTALELSSGSSWQWLATRSLTRASTSFSRFTAPSTWLDTAGESATCSSVASSLVRCPPRAVPSHSVFPSASVGWVSSGHCVLVSGGGGELSKNKNECYHSHFKLCCIVLYCIL